MLAPPEDNPLFEIPAPTPEQFFNPQGAEDEQLLKTGAWDNDPEDDPDDDS